MKPKFNLDELKRENVFQVPENYFDRLPNRIMQRVTTSPEAASWLPARWRLALTGSGFAAVFAAVFLLNVTPENPGFNQQLAQVNDTEILNYLMASEQLERYDLAVLNAADQDLTHQFMNLNQNEITEALAEEEMLDETIY